jgi:hypothetical protein
VFETVGSAGWIVAAIAAALALSRRADGRRSVAVILLLVISAVPITFHVTPFGPVGLAMFIAAILLVVRDRAAAYVAPRESSHDPTGPIARTSPDRAGAARSHP